MNTRHSDVNLPVTLGDVARVRKLYAEGIDLHSAKRIVQKENEVAKARALLTEISMLDLAPDVRSLLSRIVELAWPAITITNSNNET